jgi:hypothetical protein
MTTADAVARPIDQRARKQLEEQILECGPTITSLHGIGTGLMCQYSKGTEKYHLYVRFDAGGKRVYKALGDYPTLTCDEILEARNELYWDALGVVPPKTPKTEEKEMEEKNAKPKVASDHEEPVVEAQEPAEAAAAGPAGEDGACEEERTPSFADRIEDLLWGIRRFDEKAQVAILRAAIDEEEERWS